MHSSHLWAALNCLSKYHFRFSFCATYVPYNVFLNIVHPYFILEIEANQQDIQAPFYCKNFKPFLVQLYYKLHCYPDRKQKWIIAGGWMSSYQAERRTLTFTPSTKHPTALPVLQMRLNMGEGLMLILCFILFSKLGLCLFCVLFYFQNYLLMKW